MPVDKSSVISRSMVSWARLIQTYEEVPESFRSYFKQFAYELAPFPYAVFIPPEIWFRKKANAKMIYLFENTVVILEKRNKEIKSTCYHFEDINHIEAGTILLNSWIKIYASSKEGQTSTTLYYNTVAAKTFKPLIEALRTPVKNSGLPGLNSELSKFDYLNHVNYKFMNCARESLRQGQRVIYTALQPEIRIKAFQLFKKVFFKRISSTHMHILTDNEFIIISEGKSDYGEMWSYFPLKKISEVSIEEGKESDIFHFIIKPAGEECMRYHFTLSNKPAFDKMSSKVDKLKTA